MTERLTVTIDRFEMRYPPGRWGAKYHYEAIDNPFEPEGSKAYPVTAPHRCAKCKPIRLNFGNSSVVAITEALRRVYGKNTRIVQKWDGKERK